MKAEISYYEYRTRGGTNITLNAEPRTPEELETLLTNLRGPQVAPPVEPPPGGPIEPPFELPPTTRQPYFDVGDGEGKAGEIVEIPVIGGCRFPVNGFHIGGGLSGYGKFRAVNATLGPFLRAYLKMNDMIEGKPDGSEVDHFWSIFQFVNHDLNKALPEEWWEYAMAFFSISQERPPLPSIQIPVDTLLFTLKIQILDTTAPGEYELTCKDEHYYTHAVRRRRDFTYTNEQQGVTKVDCQGGKLTVVA